MERNILPASGIRSFFFSMSPPNSAKGILVLLLAALRSTFLVARFRPRVTVATGGYVSVPAVIASWLLRTPILLVLPDVVPGKAVSWLAPLSKRIAVTTEASLDYFPHGKAVVTGYPVRDVFRGVDKRDARAQFGLPDEALVLCVFGGSLGSRSINIALARHLPSLLDRYFVVHICGAQRLPEAQAAAAQLDQDARERYRLFSYLHDQQMAAALVAADLAICRSGASTIGELPAVGVPAILVPLPDRAVHQDEIAKYLSNRGAAVVIEDQDLGAELLPAVSAILDDPQRRQVMRKAMTSLDRPDAAANIARLVEDLEA